MDNMKLKNIFSTILIGALAFVGCTEGYETTALEELQLSKTFVSIPVEGGEATVDLTANADWSFDKLFDESETPEWLTVAPLSGKAGDAVKLTFKAGSTDSGRETALVISVGGKKQNITVRQGEVAASQATCKEVIDGPDGKSYIVTGVVTSIANTTYGNWYLKDDTGEIYIYGTLDSEGKEKNFSSLNIEVGDEVTVKGPKTTYGSTIELVNVKVVELKKAILKGLTPNLTIGKDGGEVEAKFIVKGDGPTFKMPADVRDWASVVDFSTLKSQDIDDPDTTVVKIFVEPNAMAAREGSITFNSKSKDGSTDAIVTISQEGSIQDVTAAEINAAEDGPAMYRLTGCISDIVNTKYGNLHIADYTGSVYVYGVLNADGEGGKFADMGINPYDIVTVEGPKTSYKGDPQMKNVTVVNHIPVTTVTVADFTGKEDNKEVYYSLTGTVKNIKMDGDKPNAYGNFDLEDATGSVYVYGLLQGWGGPSKKFNEMNVKEGDKITIVGVHASYKGSVQVGSAFYVSHVE